MTRPRFTKPLQLCAGYVLLHVLIGLAEPVKASFRYLSELRTRLAALGRQL